MKAVLTVWLSPKLVQIRLHPRITTFLYVEFGGEISSIGFGFDKKTWNEIRSNSDSVLETLNKFYDDFEQIQRATYWNGENMHLDFSNFKGAREEYLNQCEIDLKNKYLSRDGKSKIESTITSMKKRIQDEIFIKLQRKDFAKMRRKVISQLLETAGYKCQSPECGKRDDLTIDHVIPVTRHGKNEISNFQVLCRSCNSSKGNKLPHERQKSDHRME